MNTVAKSWLDSLHPSSSISYTKRIENFEEYCSEHAEWLKQHLS